MNRQRFNLLANNVFLPFSVLLTLCLTVTYCSTSVAAGLEEQPDIKIEWEAPTLKTDGNPIVNLTGYRLYHKANNGQESVIDIAVSETSYTLVDVAFGVHSFQIQAVEHETLEGPKSGVLVVPVPETEEAPPAEMTIKAFFQICLNGKCEETLVDGGS